MSEHPTNDPRVTSGSIVDRGELEAPVSTVRLDDLFAVVRRHIRLVLGVAAVVVAAAGYVAYVKGSVYRAVAVIRLSDPRRALTGGVVDDPALGADGRYADPLLSQVELLKSHAVAGGVVDSMPMLRVVLRKSSRSLLERVLRRRLSPDLLGDVAVAADAPADSLPLTFDRDGFVVGAPPERRRAAYDTVVKVDGVRFTVLRLPRQTRLARRRLSTGWSTSSERPARKPRSGNRDCDASFSRPSSRSTIRSWPVLKRRSRRFGAGLIPMAQGSPRGGSRPNCQASSCSASSCSPSAGQTRTCSRPSRTAAPAGRLSKPPSRPPGLPRP